MATFRPEMETILGPYLAKNGTYRSNELLKAVYQASSTPLEGAKFILAVTNAAPYPDAILEDLGNASWLAEQAREPMLVRQIEIARAHPDGPRGALGYQRQLLEFYLAKNQLAKAQAIYDSLPSKSTGGSGAGEQTIEDRIILAVRTNRLQALLDAWRADPDTVPTRTLTAALYQLMQPAAAYKPDWAAIRPLEEFLFEYKRQNNSLAATDFLALAQLRMDTGELPGAIKVLRQLTLQPVSSNDNGAAGYPFPGESGIQPVSINDGSAGTNPYIHTDYAAALLEKNHHPAEAIPFLQSLVDLVPWEPSYRCRLAQAELSSSAHDQARENLLTVARDALALYALRVQAARALAPLIPESTELGSQELGSKELALIAHPANASAARQPYFAQARIALASLASTSSSDRELLLREAIAISPGAPTAARARLDLLLLEPATADPSATLAILRSIDNAPAVDSAGSQTGTEPDSTAELAASADATESAPQDSPSGSAIGASGEVNVPAVSLPRVADELSLAARIRLASQIASANQRDGDLVSALAYAELAVSLAAGPPQPGLASRRDELKMAVLLDRRNGLRRPYLRAELAQSSQVRPRLNASFVGGLLQEQSQ